MHPSLIAAQLVHEGALHPSIGAALAHDGASHMDHSMMMADGTSRQSLLSAGNSAFLTLDSHGLPASASFPSLSYLQPSPAYSPMVGRRADDARHDVLLRMHAMAQQSSTSAALHSFQPFSALRSGAPPLPAPAEPAPVALADDIADAASNLLSISVPEVSNHPRVGDSLATRPDATASVAHD